MDTSRYHFSNFLADDDLSIIAVQARQVMEQNDNIVQIFRINNEILYGHSPRQVLFLMKQNNKSIFSPRSSRESSPSGSKPHESISTPIRCNPDTTNMPRRCLPLEDAEEKECHPANVEFNTLFGRQKQIEQPAHRDIINSPIDKTGTSEEQFASRVGSTSSKESSPTTEIAKMTKNLTMVDKEFGSPAKKVGNIDIKCQESPPSAEVSVIKEGPVMAEKDLSSPAKEVGNIKLGSQESPRTAELARLTSSLTVDDKVSRNLIRDDQMAGNSATHQDSPKHKEIAGKSEKTDSTNENLVGYAEGMKISEPVLIRSETPSPIKRTKDSITVACDSHEFGSPAKRNKMGENSPEDTEVIVSRIPGDKLNISPNETIKEIARGDRKRKSFSPKKRTATLFQSMPRVIKLPGEEIDIEVVDLEYGASPTTSRSKSADYRSTSPGNISPVGDKSKSATSPKTPEQYLRPSERAISAGSSRNVSGTSSPSSDDDVFAGKYPSSSPSIVATATRDRSCKFEYSSQDIEANPILLKATIQKFKTLLDIRDRVVKKSFASLESFKVSLGYIKYYIFSIVNILMMLDLSGKYPMEEFKEIVRDGNAIAEKLLNKIKSWQKDVNFDIDVWHRCFQQIERLKALKEPLFNDEDEPVATLGVVQKYECEMKSIWKKMDDMIMLGDSRRALFSHFAHDVERLMKMLVKSLIFVGILQSR